MKCRLFALVMTAALGWSSASAQTNPGTSPLSVLKGGTGSTTAAGARTNLGAGTVTSTICGTGLSGGTITTTGTCALALTNATLQASPANPTATASATAVMMGLGTTCKVTPVYSGRVLLKLTAQINSSSAANDLYTVRYGTGTAPANAAAAAGIGTVIGSAGINQSVTAGGNALIEGGGIVTGLSLATQIWIDFAIQAGVGTITMTNVSCYAMEF